MDIKPITVSELQNKYKERCDSWSKIFDKILARCYREIDVAFKNTEPYCIFQVPEYMLGSGSYNVVYCSVYIIKKLKESGYNVKFFDPNILFISWSYTPRVKQLLFSNSPQKMITEGRADVISEIETEPAPRKEVRIPSSNGTQRHFRDIGDYVPSGRFV